MFRKPMCFHQDANGFALSKTSKNTIYMYVMYVYYILIYVYLFVEYIIMFYAKLYRGS